MAKIEFQHTSHEGKSAVGYTITGSEDEISNFFQGNKHLINNQIDVHLNGDSSTLSSKVVRLGEFESLKNMLAHIKLENRESSMNRLTEAKANMIVERDRVEVAFGRR